MTPILTFFFGLLLLGLFAWYFSTESDGKKRWLGLALTILLLLFCLDSATPPEKKIRLGLDLRGGTSFLLQLVPQNGQEITSDMLQQAVDVIRKRVDPNGVGESMIAPPGIPAHPRPDPRSRSGPDPDDPPRRGHRAPPPTR